MEEVDISGAIVRVKKDNILIERPRNRNVGFTVHLLDKDIRFRVTVYEIESGLQSTKVVATRLREAIKRGYEAKTKQEINKKLANDITRIVMEHVLYLIVTFEDVEAYSLLIPTSWVDKNKNACIYLVDDYLYKIGLDYKNLGVYDMVSNRTGNAILLDIREFKSENKTFIFKSDQNLNANDRKYIACNTKDNMTECYTVDTKYIIAKGDLKVCLGH